MVRPSSRGFTIVELLIVVVVIGILAALVVSTFSGAQSKARDTRRKTDITAIAKALEMYYLDNGKYPSSSGSTTVNASWSTSNDASWQYLANALVPKYLPSLPVDPTNSPNGFTAGTSYSYSYYGGNSSSYCNHTSANQMYIIVYRYELTHENILNGDCSVNTIGPYSGYSNYRVSAK